MNAAKSFDRKGRIEGIIDHMEDSVRYYFLCDKCLKNVESSGLGQSFREDRDFVIT